RCTALPRQWRVNLAGGGPLRRSPPTGRKNRITAPTVPGGSSIARTYYGGQPGKIGGPIGSSARSSRRRNRTCPGPRRRRLLLRHGVPCSPGGALFPFRSLPFALAVSQSTERSEPEVRSDHVTLRGESRTFAPADRGFWGA